MKIKTGIILILIIAAAVSCSSRKKQSEIREFVNEVASAQDVFLSDIDKSLNSEDVVSAADAFGSKLVLLSAKSLEIKKNNPDIEKWITEPPAELKADFAKLENTEEKFNTVFQKEKMKLLIKDIKVQTAFIELGKKIEGVKFFR